MSVGGRRYGARMADELPELVVADQRAWHAWLAEHADDGRGVWLVLAKKGTTEPTSLTYDQALDEALCQGWIDGQVKRRDTATYLQRFTPRVARSAWSRRNTTLVARLLEEGRMQPRGLVEVERARADGRWDAAYAGPATSEVPPDLAAALAADADAARTFARLSSQNRFAILYRLGTVKRAETRERRIREFVAMLGRGETLYPQGRRTGEPRAGAQG